MEFTSTMTASPWRPLTSSIYREESSLGVTWLVFWARWQGGSSGWPPAPKVAPVASNPGHPNHPQALRMDRNANGVTPNPFPDGNKGAGLGTALAFLDGNGVSLDRP